MQACNELRASDDRLVVVWISKMMLSSSSVVRVVAVSAVIWLFVMFAIVLVPLCLLPYTQYSAIGYNVNGLFSLFSFASKDAAGLGLINNLANRACGYLNLPAEPERWNAPD